MKHFAILLGSIRKGRQSNKVANYFSNYLSQNPIVDSEIIDLKEYNFPLFEERLKYLSEPTEKVLDFAKKIKAVDAVIVVSPEYNGSFPASLKNVIDLLRDEWYHKPIGLVTVSSGSFAGLKCQVALQQTFLHLKALVSTAVFPVHDVELAFDPQGQPTDVDAFNKRADVFIKELIWLSEKNL
jgi:NAD(P)H-dependent FMN reductase